ncbi:hypothetical protein [Microbacterium arborescens]|uniref:hypothetical protein n=1 Tax=Microbacterium arborescens TaxID=33883 RepID=UPI003C7121DB
MILALMLAAESGIPPTAWITFGGAVLVAIISGVVALIVRVTRTPIQIQDLWAENAKLRDRIDSLDGTVRRLISDRNQQIDINRIVGEGFDALSNYVEREAEAAGRSPRFTPREHEAIERAKAIRNDDDLWATTPTNAST